MRVHTYISASIEPKQYLGELENHVFYFENTEVLEQALLDLLRGAEASANAANVANTDVEVAVVGIFVPTVK